MSIFFCKIILLCCRMHVVHWLLNRFYQNILFGSCQWRFYYSYVDDDQPCCCNFPFHERQTPFDMGCFILGRDSISLCGSCIMHLIGLAVVISHFMRQIPFVLACFILGRDSLFLWVMHYAPDHTHQYIAVFFLSCGCNVYFFTNDSFILCCII